MSRWKYRAQDGISTPVQPSIEVVILIGLQGAGKTTFYRTVFSDTHLHVSKDNFRNARNREKRQHSLLRDALERGVSVVVDNTNPTAAVRAPVIELAKSFPATAVVGYYFESQLSDCSERNSRRTGKDRVPDAALYVTAAKLELPSYNEGFDQLFYVRIVQGGV